MFIDTELYFIGVSMMLISSIPVFIYLMYGREPKIDYNAKYETDLPTNDPPAIVNAICSDGVSKRVGVPDLDGFRATILDLIDRNYLLLSNKSGGNCSSGSLFLEINQDYDPDTLWNFEVQVLDFLKKYEQNGIVSMDLITESLAYYNTSKLFKYTYKNWKKEVKKVIVDGNFKEAFHSKGDRYLKIFGFLGLVTAYIVFRYTSGYSKSIVVLCVILGAVSLISLVLPQKIAGQWTKYGREYYAQWHSFKKYIEDYSLIKEYPPESVNVWNRYMVYATALGDADGVKKAMKLSFPEDQRQMGDIQLFHDCDDLIFSLLDNAFTAVFEQD